MSQAVIGNLRVNLGLDTAQFDTGAKKAQSSLAGLSNSIRGFATGIAGALTLGGVASVLQTSITRMDELGEAAEKAGMSAEAFSAFEYAARVAGVNVESLTATMARFSRQIVEISEGGENDAAAALRSLGISALDAQGRLRPAADVITDVAARFATMEDSAHKTALAIALFGRSGADMIPFLNGGREAITRATAEAQAFGLVVSREASQAAANFNDNLARLHGASQGLTQQIAMNMLPAMNDVTNAMVAFAAEGHPARQVADALSWLMREAAKGAIFLSQALTEVSELIVFMGEAVPRLGRADFAGMSDAWAASQARVKAALDANTEAMRRLNEETQRSDIYGKGDLPAAVNPRTYELVPPAKTAPGLARSTTQTRPAPIVPQIPPATISGIHGAGDAIRTLSQEVETAQNQADSLARSISDGLVFALTDVAFNAKSAGEAMEMLKASALDMLRSITEQLLRSGLNMLLGNAGTAFGGAMGLAGFGGFYARGGTLGAGKWGIAGENGPEIIHGPARVTPMDGRRGGGVTVNNRVINNSGAAVQTRATQNRDGSVNIETLIEEKVLDTLGGGRAARINAARYGARIAPRRT